MDSQQTDNPQRWNMSSHHPATLVSPSASAEVSSSSIDVPINLEVSLGRIEDDDSSHAPIRSSSHFEDMDVMSCCDQAMDDESIYRPRTTSTSEGRNRLPPLNQAHIISPYPYSQTEVEIRERERLAGDVEHLRWTFRGGPLGCGDDDGFERSDDTCTTAPMSTGPRFEGDGTDAAPAWPHSDLGLIPDDDDNCEDFSISSDEAGTLVVEDLGLEEDPSSFWEDGIEVNGQVTSDELSSLCCISVASHRVSTSSSEA